MKQAGGGPGGVGTDRSWREIPLCLGGGPDARGQGWGQGASQQVAESQGGAQAEAVRLRPLCQAEWAGRWPTR